MIRLVTIAALAVWLAGCAGDDNKLGRALVAPGGYEFYDCAQLAAQDKSLTNRSH
ncbi:MAG: twin-arginine translocation pathway signal, partial [Pseudolabrys sp.]|nr:twin-arginine translocation pathway signal [Pseudolabrys sp.]